MPRGGKRVPGEGKKLGRAAKPKIEKQKTVSKEIAERVFATIDEVEMHREFLHPGKKLDDLSDIERKERERELERLTNRKYGLPAQKSEETIIFDPNQPLRVLIEHIGRPQDQAATKAK